MLKFTTDGHPGEWHAAEDTGLWGQAAVFWWSQQENHWRTQEPVTGPAEDECQVSNNNKLLQYFSVYLHVLHVLKYCLPVEEFIFMFNLAERSFCVHFCNSFKGWNTCTCMWEAFIYGTWCRYFYLKILKLGYFYFIVFLRWKEECQSITEKFECKINDLRSEVSHLKKRNDELTSLLRESQTKTLEVGTSQFSYTVISLTLFFPQWYVSVLIISGWEDDHRLC